MLIEAGLFLLLGYAMPETEPLSSPADNPPALSLPHLPRDVVNEVLHQLSFQDLLSLTMVCKSWHQWLNAGTPTCDAAYQLKGWREMRRQSLDHTMGIPYLMPAFFNRDIFNQQQARQQALELIEVIAQESTYGMKSLPCNHFKNLYETGLYSLEGLVEATSVENTGVKMYTKRFETVHYALSDHQNGQYVKKTKKWRLPLIDPDNLLKDKNISSLHVKGLNTDMPLLGLSKFRNLGTVTLKNLRLANCAVLGMLKNLLQLRIYSVDIKALPKELVYLYRLNNLEITQCNSLNDLSVVSQMDSLYRLNLKDNQSLTQLPNLPKMLTNILVKTQPCMTNIAHILSQTTGLRAIVLHNNNLTKLPEAILKQPKLEILSIEEPTLPQSEINKLTPLKQNPDIQIRPEALKDMIP